MNDNSEKHVDQVISRCCGKKKVKTFSHVDPSGRTIWKDEGGNRWYGVKCPDCYKKYKDQYDSNRRLKLGHRPHGSTDVCPCGKKFIVRVGVKKMCPSCSGKQLRAIVEKAKKS